MSCIINCVRSLFTLCCADNNKNEEIGISTSYGHTISNVVHIPYEEEPAQIFIYRDVERNHNNIVQNENAIASTSRSTLKSKDSNEEILHSRINTQLHSSTRKEKQNTEDIIFEWYLKNAKIEKQNQSRGYESSISSSSSSSRSELKPKDYDKRIQHISSQLFHTSNYNNQRQNTDDRVFEWFLRNGKVKEQEPKKSFICFDNRSIGLNRTNTAQNEIGNFIHCTSGSTLKSKDSDKRILQSSINTTAQGKNTTANKSRSKSKSKSKLKSSNCNNGVKNAAPANSKRPRSTSRNRKIKKQKPKYEISNSMRVIRCKSLWEEYPLPENRLQEVKEIYNKNGSIKDIVKALDKQYKLPVLDYFSKREFFLHLQECGQIISFEKLSQNEISLNNLTNNKFSINLTGIPNGDIELDSNVLAIFTDAENTEKKFEARVKDVTDNDIIFEYKNSATLPNIQSNKFNVRFFWDRYHLKLGHTTLDLLKKTKWDTLLEPEINNIRFKIKPPLQSRLGFKLHINEEQERAINNILRGTSCLAPYIIYGGPGTGKTHTIIEAVYQILQCQPKAHVLISSISNKRCDEICKKLLGIISKELIFRYNSKFSRRSKDLHDLSEVKPQINQEKKKKSKTVCNYKVVIATLATCAKLPQMEISTNHFTHVFIDDCNTATEIETLGAVAGIITSCNGIEGNLILAGDPKQFCPTIIGIKPHLCEDLGLLQSFIERLLNRELYKNDRDNIFKINLFKNYRSHPAILRVPNNQFYEGQLEVVAPLERRRAVINMNIPFLPNPNVPVIFHTIGGKAERKRFLNSYFKLSEINLVMKYLDRLMKIPNIKMDEVGVITPYKIQAIKIEERCKNEKINVEVGTVAKFLGKEKRIIILSTVKTEFDGISFRKSGKIFNTAVTRAKDLLIVLGDVKELEVDTNWKKFIEYYRLNNLIKNYIK